MKDRSQVFQFAMSRLDKIITDVDNKANFLLCFSTVVLGGMMFIVKDIQNKDCLFNLQLLLTFLAFSTSSIFSFLTFFPRYPLAIVPSKSIFFFMNINIIDNTKELLEDLTDGSVEQDYLNQMKQLSYIIVKKINKVKIAIWCAGIGTILAGVVFVMTFQRL